MAKGAKETNQRAQQRMRTRAAILDATEAIMREEGYAAVSSRKIAEKAGLKSQLVHYHFDNMDDLFLALFRRSEEAFFTRLSEIVTSSDPLLKLWELSLNTEQSALVIEFTAIAMQRKVFRDELIRSAGMVRSLEWSIVSKVLNDEEKFTLEVNPRVLSFILQSVSRALIMESGVGITKGHAEIMAYFQSLLAGSRDADSRG
jgi:AcrR family transcriptional regulator